MLLLRLHVCLTFGCETVLLQATGRFVGEGVFDEPQGKRGADVAFAQVRAILELQMLADVGVTDFTCGGEQLE